MRKLTIAIGLVVLFTTCKWDKGEKADVIPSLRLFPGVTNPYGTTAALTSDSCVLLCGNRNSKVLLLKLTLQGDVVWERIPEIGTHTAIAVNAAGNGAMVAANFLNTSTGPLGVRCIGFDGDGDTLYVNQVSNAMTSTQAFDMVGGKIAVKSGNSSVAIITVNSNGTVSNYHGLTLTNQNLTVSSVANTTAGTNMIGSSSSAGMCFFKSGTMMTVHPACNSGFDCGGETAVKVLGGGYDPTVCGYIRAGNNTKMLLLKTDNQFQTVGKYTYGIAGLDYEATSIIREWNGNYILAGTVADKENDIQNIALLKTDPSGNQLWLREFHIPGRIESGVNVLQAPGGDLIITGNSGENLFFMRTTIDGIPL